MTKIPVPDGKRYLPYQKEGIRFALPRKTTLIGDDMGLGKTIQAIGVMNADPVIRRVLVICPATLKINWKREIKAWSVTPRRIKILESSSKRRALVSIVNYDILHRVHGLLSAIKWDLIIVDECHCVKNRAARRTKMVLGGQYRKVKYPRLRGRRMIWLSGTPMKKSPIDLWTAARCLDSKDLGSSYMKFVLRYCGMRKGYRKMDLSGAMNLEELNQRLRVFMIRRLKIDVMKDLPPKRRQVIELPANAATRRLLRDEMRVYLSQQEYIDATLRSGRGLMPGHELNRNRQEVALAKVPQVIDHLRDCIEENGPVVCFAHHREVVRRIALAFRRVGVVTGSTPMAERQEVVDRFQDGKLDLFVGNIQAAGVGLNLTRSSLVVFAELDWIPSNLSQAEDRLHRIGQRDSVLVQHLVLEGSLDRRIVKILIKRQKVLDIVLA